MQIERTIAGVTTLGPGKRIVTWVNGCRRNCPGCVSPELQKDAPENECCIEEHFDGFDFADADGFTISGGEPFDQPEELLSLIKYIKNRGVNDILVYTGYTIEELREINSQVINEVLSKVAAVIDGPYIEELNCNTGNIKGSSNQKLIIINNEFRERYERYFSEERKMQEFIIGNTMIAAGIPSKEYIKEFKRK